MQAVPSFLPPFAPLRSQSLNTVTQLVHAQHPWGRRSQLQTRLPYTQRYGSYQTVDFRTCIPSQSCLTKGIH